MASLQWLSNIERVRPSAPFSLHVVCNSSKIIHYSRLRIASANVVHHVMLRPVPPLGKSTLIGPHTYFSSGMLKIIACKWPTVHTVSNYRQYFCGLPPGGGVSGLQVQMLEFGVDRSLHNFTLWHSASICIPPSPISPDIVIWALIVCVFLWVWCGPN